MNNKEWQIINLDNVDSTNNEAKKHCFEPGGKTVIVAKHQTAGRGRRGRTWQSLEGNLFFSLALEFNLADLGKLVMISALSVLRTIKLLHPSVKANIKWPNDILLNNKKVCGILLEKGNGDYMIVGIGVNIMQSPQDDGMLYPTTSLLQEGIDTTTTEFLQHFLPIFSELLLIYEKQKFSQIRQEWEFSALGIGKKIEIRQDNKIIRGIFLGIDDTGSLLLKTSRNTEKIVAGDVFYIK